MSLRFGEGRNAGTTPPNRIPNPNKACPCGQVLRTVRERRACRAGQCDWKASQ